VLMFLRNAWVNSGSMMPSGGHLKSVWMWRSVEGKNIFHHLSTHFTFVHIYQCYYVFALCRFV